MKVSPEDFLNAGITIKRGELSGAPEGDGGWTWLWIIGGVVLGIGLLYALRERTPVITEPVPTISTLPAPTALDIVRAKYPEFGL